MLERVVRALGLALVLAVLFARPAQADEGGDIARFIAGRPELAKLVGKVATKVGPGTYKLDADTGPTRVFVVKAGSGWAAALTVDPKALDLRALIPGSVLGDATVTNAMLVVAAGPGSIDGAPLGAKDLGTQPVIAGPNVFVQISIGTSGTLGQLAAAGVVPAKPMWIMGSLGGGAVESLLAGKPASLGSLDFSIAARVASFTPAPFSLIASPKLTLGEATLTFARTRGAFTVSGEQAGTRLVIGARTIEIPKTTLTFTASGGGGRGGGAYDVAISGKSNEAPWTNAFGLSGVDLEAIGLTGTISSTPSGTKAPPIKGFGLGLTATVRINQRDYDGQFSIKVENNTLQELTLALAGDLNLGFLPGGKDFTFKSFALAFTPASQQVALAGELQWRSLSGRAALVLSNEPILLFGLKGFNLATLLGDKVPSGPALPTLDVLLTAGFAGKTGEVTNLPSVAQALVDEFAGASAKVKLANGIGLVTRGDAKAIGADKLGIRGPLLLAGSVDLVKGSFRLAASLTTIPPIPGLPAGFAIESPELFVAVDQKSGAPVASFGLAMRLVVPVDARQRLAFTGSLSASTAGSFAFTGSLDSNWENPFGLAGITVLAPVVVSVGVNADASVDLGFQAGMSIAKQTYAPMAMCVNLQAAAPVPVPKKLAFKFKGTELGPKVQLEILEALVKSVINGPLANATTDPATKRALAALGPGVDKISDAGDFLGIPDFSFKNIDAALTTPGVTCDIPAIEGMGVKLAGTAVYNGKELGKLDAYANVTQGFKIDAKIAAFDLVGVVKISDAHLDVLAPMPGMAPPHSASDTAKGDQLKAQLAKRQKELAATNKSIQRARDADAKGQLVGDRDDLQAEIDDLQKQIARATGPDYGHFYVSGSAEVLHARAQINVAIDRLGADFAFSAQIADLGSLALRAATEGASLAKDDDFVVSLVAGDDAADKLMKKLGAALKASAAARKKAQDDLGKGTDGAIKAAQDEAARLDRSTGNDYRAAQRNLQNAQEKLKKARIALDRAKAKCSADLGGAAALCTAVDAAKDSLQVAKQGVSAASNTVATLKKSADYVRLKSLNTTIATLKAGKDLTDKGLAGWAAVDRIGQLVVDGTTSGLITIDEVELSGSLRQLTGSLDFTVGVGDTDIRRSYELALAPGQLDLTELADEVADEISQQAVQKDSPVWKTLRKGK